MIDARSLSFRYAAEGPWLFKDLTFSLAPAQTLVLLGRNGRGKTTLLKCMAGLIAPTSGTIRSTGIVGYVPQHFASPFAYSVLDIVLMGRARHVGLFSSATAQDRQRAEQALELVGLSSLARRSIGTLSGGERQLVLIARALASEADILFLDEPTSALDFRNQAIVLSMLRRLCAERGLTIMMTTHEPTHALEIADRAILLYGAGQNEEGPVASTCTEEKLSKLYAISMRKLAYGVGEAEAQSIVASYASIDR